MTSDLSALLNAALAPYRGLPFAVAVSGGADSVALALMAHAWGITHSSKITALVVDHALRAESYEEAATVQGWLQKYGIEAHVLRGKALTPGANVQKRARDYRYRLLIDACHVHRIGHLLLGHHADDQRETMLMRLVRGSGVEGLAGISPVSEREGVRLLRPLLRVPKRALEKYLRTLDQPWLNDPSNQNLAYTRNRLRTCNTLLEEEGLSPARLATMHAHFARTADFLQEQTASFLAEAATFSPLGYVRLDWPAFRAAHPEMQHRAIHAMLSYVNGASASPRAVEVERLMARLADPAQFRGATLAGVEWLAKPQQETLWLVREAQRVESASCAQGTEFTFDHRFRFSLPTDRVGRYRVQPILDHEAPLQHEYARAHDLPRRVLRSLPGLFHLDQLVAQPHIGLYLDPHWQSALRVRYLPEIARKKVAGTVNHVKIMQKA